MPLSSLHDQQFQNDVLDPRSRHITRCFLLLLKNAEWGLPKGGGGEKQAIPFPGTEWGTKKATSGWNLSN